MAEIKRKEKYTLTINLLEEQAKQIKPGQHLLLERRSFEKKDLQLQVTNLRPAKEKRILPVIIKDFRTLYKAVFIPLRNASSRAKLYSLAFLYAFLIPSGIGVFFVRGWRFEIVKRMINSEDGKAVAPGVQSLDQLGCFIRDGIRLFGAKALYDVPKILVLVAVGYDHYELIIEWVHYFLLNVPGMEGSKESFSDLAESSGFSLSLTLLLKLFFFLLTAFILTPAFKISMMKYATGKISYAGFFSVSEIKDSFRIYRKYKTTTITVYLWDSFVSGFSNIIGFILIILFPFIIWFIIPMYKLLFKHWPKAYGYGELARRLVANGEI